jgi:hypothetical protein
VEGKDGVALIQLQASNTASVITAGAKDRPGQLTMSNGINNAVIVETIYGGSLTMNDLKGNTNVSLVAALGGELSLFDANKNQTVDLKGTDATLTMGGGGTNGNVTVWGKDEQPLVQLLAQDTEAIIGAGKPNRPGRLTMYGPGTGNNVIVNLSAIDATLTLGGNGQDGKISVSAKDGKEAIRLDAATGDVTLKGSDCAEQFDMHDASSAEPGTIVVIDDEGRLRESQCAYDKRVAGVVSGAGEYRPAIVLDKQSSSEGRASVALVGKVYCKVDADPAPITVGDLLTTSVRPGFAMKATDSAHAFGAVIGKALRPLRAGQGMIPILVALQ